MYSADIVADSTGPHRQRLTTMVVTFPRFMLAEFNTHRVLSRNAASSRAIPTATLIKQVKDTPFVPQEWGSNQKGMTAGAQIVDTQKASSLWLEARDKAVFVAEALSRQNVHKQLVNRVLEPFMWTTVVVGATDWRNFFHLRTQPDAQPEFQALAALMQLRMKESVPAYLEHQDWHLPFITDEEKCKLGPLSAASISAARCARVSYMRQDQRDAARDLELADKLLISGHMSPFEHPAQCLPVPARWGNYVGFKQYRKLIPNEDDPKGPVSD